MNCYRLGGFLQHLEEEGANDTMGTKSLIVIKQQAMENPNLH